jgi:ribosomal protein S17E
MGNSIQKPLKTKAGYMKEQIPELGDNFEQNKKKIKGLKLPISKKTTNRMAGYLVRETKKARKHSKEE